MKTYNMISESLPYEKHGFFSQFKSVYTQKTIVLYMCSGIALGIMDVSRSPFQHHKHCRAPDQFTGDDLCVDHFPLIWEFP